jgi:hypothetical protein
MDTQKPTCPLNQTQVTDQYFLEHRAKLLDLAAFLDRVERAIPDGRQGTEDFRLRALRHAMAILLDGKPERARRVLEAMSDPTVEPIAKAPGKGAAGAWPEPTDAPPSPLSQGAPRTESRS